MNTSEMDAAVLNAVSEMVRRAAQEKAGVDLPWLMWQWRSDDPGGAPVLSGTALGSPDRVARDLQAWADALALVPRPARDAHITEYDGELAGTRIRVSGCTSDAPCERSD